MTARLQERYKDEVMPEMVRLHGYSNSMAIPKVTKVVVNMGVGKAIQNPKRLEAAMKDLSLIVGQWPAVTQARRSVAGFHLREGMRIGCKATVRGRRMYEFLDRLVGIAIPRIRDFRGLSTGGFDGRGNYSLGLSEQLIFPEVNADRLEFVQGMDIAVVTTAKTDEEGADLLRLFGFPFRRQ